MAKILFATTAAGVKFYPVTITDAVVHIKGNTQTKLSELLDAIDYSGKADKVSGAVSGNFAGLDNNGNLVDSGSKASDFQVAGDYKTIQTAVTDPTADGNAYSFIDTLSQDTNGEITATKKTIPDAAASTNGVGGTKGLLSAADKETIDGLSTAFGEKADKVASATNGNFAGLDANGNLTDSGSSAASFDAAGSASAAQTAAEGYADGLIAALDATEEQTAGADGLALSITEVDGVITSISGSIAANTYDAYGDAAQALADAIGESTDTASADTINGAKAYADDAIATAIGNLAGALLYKGEVNGTTKTLPSSGMTAGDVYVVSAAGTYDGAAMEVGDYLIYNGTGWDKLNGENQVNNANASLTIGTAVTVGTVDGTDITVTQVEDMTKIEAVAVADTTDYADVTNLFTAPAAGE